MEGYIHMFKRFNWLTLWLIGTVTAGIYHVIAMRRLTKQQNEMADRLGDDKVMGYIGVILLGFITCWIVPLVWTFRFCKQQAYLAQAKGVETIGGGKPFLMWLFMLIPVLRSWVVCTNHNRLCDVYEE